jgi:hypothetical protein
VKEFLRTLSVVKKTVKQAGIQCFLKYENGRGDKLRTALI